jgi:hypothetical protein
MGLITRFFKTPSGGLAGVGVGVSSAQAGVVGPQTRFAPVSPTSAFGTFGSNYTVIYWRRVGDKMHISGRFECGTVPASTLATLTIPLGLHAVNHLDYEVVGYFTRNNGSANVPKGGVVMTYLNDTTRILFARKEYALAVYPTVPENSDVVLGNSYVVHTDGEWVIPIAEWAGA